MIFCCDELFLDSFLSWKCSWLIKHWKWQLYWDTGKTSSILTFKFSSNTSTTSLNQYRAFMENFQSGVNPNKMKCTFCIKGNLNPSLVVNLFIYTKYNRPCPLLLHTCCGTDRIISWASDRNHKASNQHHETSRIFCLCRNTNWDTFVSVIIWSTETWNWTGATDAVKTSLYHYSRFVFLVDSGDSLSPTYSLTVQGILSREI